jgi:N-formylglutamate amidohydrolase
MPPPDPTSAWIVHPPHAATLIPPAARADLLLSDADLAAEVLRMTDHLTDALVAGALAAAPRVVFPVSRLVVDPERFPDDAEEPMSRVGMGVIYERTSHGLPLRNPPGADSRRRLLETYYAPHHAALERAVATARERYGHCTILDVHSFPSRPLPYEPDQDPDRPDICIGTDAFHTPAPLAQAFVHRFAEEGLSVAVDRPFAGTLVPLRFFRRDARVLSIMVEVNRGLYLDDATGAPGARFGEVQAMLGRVLASLDEMPASLVRAAD